MQINSPRIFSGFVEELIQAIKIYPDLCGMLGDVFKIKPDPFYQNIDVIWTALEKANVNVKGK